MKKIELPFKTFRAEVHLGPTKEDRSKFVEFCDKFFKPLMFGNGLRRMKRKHGRQVRSRRRTISKEFTSRRHRPFGKKNYRAFFDAPYVVSR